MIGVLYITKAEQSRQADGQTGVTPDIMVYNYPVGEGGGNNSGAQGNTLPAIYEVKTFFLGSTRVGHNTNDTYNPADRRAKLVYSEYRKKFGQLDNKFAADSEEVRSGTRGPFSKAQDCFYTNGIIALVAGPYGIMNKDFNKSIYKWAECAAASKAGREVSTLTNMDKKGGAMPIMLQQFRRVISTEIVRGMAELKLSRMHYLRVTKQQRCTRCSPTKAPTTTSRAKGG